MPFLPPGFLFAYRRAKSREGRKRGVMLVREEAPVVISGDRTKEECRGRRPDQPVDPRVVVLPGGRVFLPAPPEHSPEDTAHGEGEKQK